MLDEFTKQQVMRRYWYEALPGKTRKSPEKTPAEIGFDYCNQLFRLEEEYAKSIQNIVQRIGVIR